MRVEEKFEMDKIAKSTQAIHDATQKDYRIYLRAYAKCRGVKCYHKERYFKQVLETTSNLLIDINMGNLTLMEALDQEMDVMAVYEGELTIT